MKKVFRIGLVVVMLVYIPMVAFADTQLPVDSISISEGTDVSVMSIYTGANLTQENNISFPLSEYDATLYDNTEVSNYEYYKPISWFHYNGLEGCSSSNCREYGGTSECEGFARYAHDVYMHMVDDDIEFSAWLSSKHPGGRYEFDTLEQVKTFFSALNTGAYIRYGHDDDETPDNGMHSIVFVSRDENGIWAYECNQNYYKNLTSSEIGGHDKDYFGCGVFFQYFSYADILGRYNHVMHYVNHTFSITAKYKDTSTHTVGCVNCDGYLRQPHTSETISYASLSQHTVTYDCCGGTVNEDHTQITHRIYTAAKHRVIFSCCGATILQPHTLNAAGKCGLCGYDEDSPVVAPRGDDYSVPLEQ